jgi:uncharacterized lipoprotein NlpE involved in copper resistance
MQTRRRFVDGLWVVLAVSLTSFGCSGSASKTGNDDGPLAKSLGHWQGTLPCTDCAGIRIELQLFAEAGHDDGSFELRETSLGTKQGDTSIDMTGNWILEHGIDGDAAATVYRLNPGDKLEQRYYLKVGEDTLELLDANRKRIDSRLNYSLQRIAP